METTRMRWGQERLRCGDADVTIWGGLNGVGSDAIGEQSEGGLREEGFGSGIRDRRSERLHIVDTATYAQGSFSGVAPRRLTPLCLSLTHPVFTVCCIALIFDFGTC
jgi:hypothetical protein